MRRRQSVGSGFSSAPRDYDYFNETQFRFGVDKEIGDLKVLVKNLEEVSGSSVSKGVMRQNIPFFRASIVDY